MVAGRLAGKVAIVTGGGSGIGRAIALAYHEEGASILVADISGDEKETAELLGTRAMVANVDVSNEADVQRMVEMAISEFGRLDVLCNNAGIDGVLAPVEVASLENFDRVVSVNLRGTFLGMRFALPKMLAAGEGSVVNIASMAGIVALPGGAAYAASKAAVMQLTRTAAVECAGRGVRINAICPGGVNTPMTEKIDLAPAAGCGDDADRADGRTGRGGAGRGVPGGSGLLLCHRYGPRGRRRLHGALVLGDGGDFVLERLALRRVRGGRWLSLAPGCASQHSQLRQTLPPNGAAGWPSD